MPIYVSFSSTAGNSPSAGQSQVHGMSRGLTQLTPATVRFAFGVLSPRDVATGQASGKRQHEPISIVKQVDTGSPSLYGALTKGEKHPKLKVHFAWLTPQGTKQPYFTLTLMNAALIGVERKPPRHPISRNTHELEEIKLAFDKIEMTWNGGGKAFNDDWN
jgi:type VI secretion system secreted protein Hcp